MVLKYLLRKTLAEHNFACFEEAEIDKLYNTGKKEMSKISLNSEKIRRVLLSLLLRKPLFGCVMWVLFSVFLIFSVLRNLMITPNPQQTTSLRIWDGKYMVELSCYTFLK